MNVAILIPELLRGGAERAAKTLGDYLVGRGHRVYYFLFHEPAAGTGTYEVRGEVVCLGLAHCWEGETGQLPMFVNLLKAAGKYRAAKQKYRIDAAVSFMQECNYLNVLSKGRERTVTSVHSMTFGFSEMGDFRHYGSLLWLLNASDKIVPVGHAVAEELCGKYHVRQGKVRVISNPAMRRDGGREEAPWEHGGKAVVAIGRFSYEKQQDRIIRAFSYVRKRHPDARLLFLGEGRLEGYLRFVSRKCGMEDAVCFEGFRQDVGYYLEHCAAFVMASLCEGFPNAMVEAMAHGAPVVTTDSPGDCGRIVGAGAPCRDGIELCGYGILTPHMEGKARLSEALGREETLLGKAICMLLENPGMQEEYHRRSLKRAESYSYDRIMRQWEEVLFP